MRLLSRLLPALALAAAGCSSEGEKPAVHPVGGQVSYGGKPAAGVRVYFYPTDAPTVPAVPSNPHGVTGPDGRFKLSTFGDGDGAAEGGYQIVLSWPEEAAEGEEAPRSDRLLGWYELAQTKLAYRVKPGDNAVPPLDLPVRTQPPQASDGIPGRN